MDDEGPVVSRSKFMVASGSGGINFQECASMLNQRDIVVQSQWLHFVKFKEENLANGNPGARSAFVGRFGISMCSGSLSSPRPCSTSY